MNNKRKIVRPNISCQQIYNSIQVCPFELLLFFSMSVDKEECT